MREELVLAPALDENWGKGFMKPEVWATVLFYSYGGREPLK
jgi:hypothetical protein